MGNRKYTTGENVSQVRLRWKVSKDELSYMTVVRDLRTKSPELQIVLCKSKFMEL
ncbi:hypothetical protein NC653_019023 [Populus alba x Populus x berolinensis]|uniref:Uncharacterized protein n=1 Tax=Populus alba x Populus x berolinensis TaxID=444605 RepID=A0AAD6VWM6_9ROSI|nr:hypothetical protein NC653_019023 [Populus alba x Populus x berolinensis]